MYEKYFGMFTNKIFVEVGAYDGDSVSNTSFLADAGWQGFYIEPIHEYYLKCLHRHINNNVVVSNLSIGLEEGVQKIYNNGLLSSLDYEHAQLGISKFNYPQYTENICFQIRMDRYLKNYKIPYTFDLLVVDVEGKETEVFQSFDLNIWKPKMIIVELIDEHDYVKDNISIISKVKDLRLFIQNHSYNEIYKDSINTVFIKNDLF